MGDFSARQVYGPLAIGEEGYRRVERLMREALICTPEVLNVSSEASAWPGRVVVGVFAAESVERSLPVSVDGAGGDTLEFSKSMESRL